MLALQKFQPCFALDIKGVGIKMKCMTLFSEKNIALIYSSIGESFQKKTGQIRGVAVLLNSLVVTGERKVNNVSVCS